jgi:hypothetical protein
MSWQKLGQCTGAVSPVRAGASAFRDMAGSCVPRPMATGSRVVFPARGRRTRHWGLVSKGHGVPDPLRLSQSPWERSVPAHDGGRMAQMLVPPTATTGGSSFLAPNVPCFGSRRTRASPGHSPGHLPSLYQPREYGDGVECRLDWLGERTAGSGAPAPVIVAGARSCWFSSCWERGRRCCPPCPVDKPGRPRGGRVSASANRTRS